MLWFSFLSILSEEILSQKIIKIFIRSFIHTYIHSFNKSINHLFNHLTLSFFHSFFVSAWSVYFPNLSVKKATNQSSTADQDGKSSHAVDGVIENIYVMKSCIATQVQNNPWWTVDLGGVFQIASVAITSRYDCCEDNLSQVDFAIGRYTCRGACLCKHS